METISKKRLSLGSIGICKICGEKVWRTDEDFTENDTGALHIRCIRGDKKLQ